MLLNPSFSWKKIWLAGESAQRRLIFPVPGILHWCWGGRSCRGQVLATPCGTDGRGSESSVRLRPKASTLEITGFLPISI